MISTLINISHNKLQTHTGKKGQVAKMYRDLVKELWSGNAKSFAPLKLRVRCKLSLNLFITNQIQSNFFLPPMDALLFPDFENLEKEVLPLAEGF